MKPEWLDAFELDSEAGPASPLATDEAKALASKIVDRALPTAGTGLALRSSRSLFAIAGVGGALAVLGLAYSVRSSECVDGTCAGPTIAAAPASSIIATPEQPAIDSAPTAPATIDSVSVDALPNAVAPSPSTAPAPAKVSDPSARPRETASDLLAEANRPRGQREWARAAALYERVLGSQVDESYAATVALASLRLEHLGDPRGALALYERALSSRPGGALSVQAQAGAARCRRVLGEEKHSEP
ncbi:MAG: tetratricopeptide repeat protein [Myxococcales bacterium]|nr:tetratricopeptide repeat protein [Myxococcales bacterium]